MGEVFFNRGHKAVLDELLLQHPGVRAGRMFGYPAYYVGAKLFACVYGDGVGLKIPEGDASRLIRGGRAVPFRPYGKPPMREWVEIRHARSANYRKNRSLLLASARYVGSIASREKRR